MLNRFEAPVLSDEDDWYELDLPNVTFVPGKGWVAGDHLTINP